MGFEDWKKAQQTTGVPEAIDSVQNNIGDFKKWLAVKQEDKAKTEMEKQRVALLKKNAQNQGVLQSTLIGAGRELDKLGSGSADLLDTVLSKFGSTDANKRMQNRFVDQQEKDRLFAPLSEESPISTTVGSILPYLATLPVGASMNVPKAATHLADKPIRSFWMPHVGKAGERLKGFTPGALASETAIGAGTGAAHYDDTALSGALFGAGGTVAGRQLGKMFGGPENRLLPEEQRIIDFAKNPTGEKNWLGATKNKGSQSLFVPPGMSSGIISMQQMDQAIKTHRAGADSVNQALRNSKVQENKLISKELGGEPAEIFSEAYLAEQKKRIGNDMNTLLNNTEGKVTEDIALKSTQIIEDAKELVPAGMLPPILKRTEKTLYNLTQDGKSLSGDQYQNLTSKLNNIASTGFASPNDKVVARTAKALSGLFDDAIEEGIGSAGKEGWKKSRKQFALLKAIKDAKIKNKSKGTSGISGFVDTVKLAKNFKSSPIINKLAEVEALRQAQPGSSLGTSQLLAKVLQHPASATTAMLSKATDVVPPISGLFSEAYHQALPTFFSGVPGLNNKDWVKPLAERIGGRTTGLFNNPAEE